MSAALLGLAFIACASCASTDGATPTVESGSLPEGSSNLTFVDFAPDRIHEGQVEAVALGPQNDDGESCSTNGAWCVSPERRDDGDAIVPVVRAAGQALPTLPVVADNLGNETYAAWPGLVLLGDRGVLAGIQIRTSTAYSGGGGSATELRLFWIRSDGSPGEAPILTLAIQGYKMIRSCFSEADYRKSSGACHDEYGFSAHITVSPGNDGWPVFTYVTEAWAFPRGASLLSDSTERGRLKHADLVRSPDPACSFTRRFAFNPSSRRYEPDAPLPDCSAYTEL